VAVADTDRQLAWEKRHRPRAGIAALLSALGLAVYFVGQARLLNNVPKSGLLESLTRIERPGSVGELSSLQTPFFEYLDSRTPLLLAIGIGALFGFVGLAWSVGFLGVATRARMPNFRRAMIYVPIVGGVVTGVGMLLTQIGRIALADNFLAGDRTVVAARGSESSLLVFGDLLVRLGSLVIAVGLILVALNAMRAGLLTRFFGYMGVVAGATLVLFPLPVVQVFWVAGLGVLFLGRWPGGDMPAWRSGRAEPWPTRVGASPQPAPQPAAPGGRDPGARRKRKKRH